MTTSFRDPAGRLSIINGRVVRVIDRSASADFNAFLESQTVQKFLSKGLIVRTELLDDAARSQLAENPEYREMMESCDVGTVVEHERIPFQSFPYEWSPEMLWAAGALTLDIAEGLLQEGLGLKDATPYNILFRGAQPVFVDVLSIERRDSSDPIWLPSEQFQRTFLRPLLTNKHFGIGLDQIFITHRDGLFPEMVNQLSGPLQKLSPSFLSLVSLPTMFSKPTLAHKPGIYQKRTIDNPEKARFILGRQLSSLRRKLESLKPSSSKSSNWSDYMAQNNYSESYFPDKERFVQQALSEVGAERVLDVGCNTGHFSNMAAKAGAQVVSIDSDPVVIGNIWREAAKDNSSILPLMVDLTRPTPSVGWRNLECSSFLERSCGAFDCVMMLAVIHHMLITERIPLREIMRLASELTSNLLIIEYVSPEDPMSLVLSRGRDHLYQHLTREHFEQVSAMYFETVRVEQLGGTQRWLYMMRRKQDA